MEPDPDPGGTKTCGSGGSGSGFETGSGTLEKSAGKSAKRRHFTTGLFVQAATAADDSERMKKVLQNKSEDDEKRMAQLEEQLKDARYGYDALLAII